MSQWISVDQWISLCGYAQSGKDTVARILCDAYGYSRVAFADPLKALALKANPNFSCKGHVPEHAPLSEWVERLGWEYVKQYVPGVREFLQDLGVGARDVLGENVWRDKGIETALTVPHGRVVFTDSRFENELDEIERHGGIFIRVVRPGTGPANAHVSEAEWETWLGQHDGPDFTIWNDSDIPALARKVDDVVMQITSDYLRALEHPRP